MTTECEEAFSRRWSPEVCIFVCPLPGVPIRSGRRPRLEISRGRACFGSRSRSGSGVTMEERASFPAVGSRALAAARRSGRSMVQRPRVPRRGRLGRARDLRTGDQRAPAWPGSGSRSVSPDVGISSRDSCETKAPRCTSSTRAERSPRWLGARHRRSAHELVGGGHRPGGQDGAVSSSPGARRDHRSRPVSPGPDSRSAVVRRTAGGA